MNKTTYRLLAEVEQEDERGIAYVDATTETPQQAIFQARMQGMDYESIFPLDKADQPLLLSTNCDGHVRHILGHFDELIGGDMTYEVAARFLIELSSCSAHIQSVIVGSLPDGTPIDDAYNRND